MKRFLCTVIMVIFLLGHVEAYNGNITVFITKTGECYHRDNCTYLYSRREITLERAVQRGYRRCSRCKPPILGEDQDTDRDPYMTASERKEKEAAERAHQEQLEMEENRKRMESPEYQEEIRRKERKEKWEAFFANGIELLGYGLILSPLFWGNNSSPKKRRNYKGKKASSLADPSKVRQGKGRKQLQPVAVSFEPEGFSIPDVPDQSYMREAYRELYEGKSISKLSGLPKDIWFDAEGYPHRKHSKGKDDFTVLITQKGKCYHTASCSNASRGHAVNICYAKQFGKAPCERCKPMDQLPKCVSEYQRISRICKAFGIETKP